MAKLKVKIIDKNKLTGAHNTIRVSLRRVDGSDNRETTVVLKHLPNGHIGKTTVKGLGVGQWTVLLTSPGWSWTPREPTVRVKNDRIKMIVFTIKNT